MLKFEKVSYEQFKSDVLSCKPELYLYDSENFEDKVKDAYDKIILPKRATKGSAGYDFYSPFDFKIAAESSTFGFSTMFGIGNVLTKIPTGIRVVMPSNMVLKIYPRSGLGFKSGEALANTVGIIDSDYYYSDNEGHIIIGLKPGFATLEIKAGDRFCQGIFDKYYITDDDSCEESRDGGFGSTGKN